MNVTDAVQKLRCALRWHRWGAAEAGVHEVHQTCTRCGHTRRLTTAEPPQMHDQMRIHR